MTAADLAARVSAKRIGKEYRVCCPVHGDKNASLEFRDGDKGIVFQCRSQQCVVSDILAAWQLTAADVMTGRATDARTHTPFVYGDEHGAPLFQSVCVVPGFDGKAKSFYVQHPDGRGGWEKGFGGARRVPYNRAGIQGTATVFIPEGEKHVDRLVALGLAATCNVGGAGKWTDTETAALVAAGVQNLIVLPDHDQPGHDHGQLVARLAHGAGLQVKVLDLPGLAPKGDVSDWLAAGHSKDELLALVQATPLWKPDATVTSTNGRAPIVTFLSCVQPEAVDWLWPGRIAVGKYTLFAGEPGLGKTFAMLDVNARVSRGTAFPDGTIAPKGRVLKLTAEDGLADTIRPRIDALGGDPSQIAVLEAVKERDGTRSAISLVRDLQVLAEAIREVDPMLVDIDPLNAYLGGTDTHRDSEVRAALTPILDMAAHRRFALVGIGHLSKDAQRAALHRPGGSIAFVAAARIVLGLVADQQDPERRLLVPLKSNICRPAATLAFRITDDRLAWEADAVADVDVEALFRSSTPSDREEHSGAEQVIVDLLADEASWPLEARLAMEAGQANGVNERTLRRAAKRLGIRIEKSGFGHGGKWLWYRPAATKGTHSGHVPQNTAACPLSPLSKNPWKEEEEALKSVLRGHGPGVLETEAPDPSGSAVPASGSRATTDTTEAPDDVF
ncbi:MAG TPA: AAA family ATPase [Vicinamibacterales bacterium]|nr:AAA family ATPase [Vicinamibacterales bacterium]